MVLVGWLAVFFPEILILTMRDGCNFYQIVSVTLPRVVASDYSICPCFKNMRENEKTGKFASLFFSEPM